MVNMCVRYVNPVEELTVYHFIISTQMLVDGLEEDYIMSIDYCCI